MKTYIYAILLSISFVSQAQIATTLYYNEQWQLTSKDSSNYYRTCSIDPIKKQFIGEVKDFTKDGKLLMSGEYQRTDKTHLYLPHVKNGIFTSYYPSGQIESQGQFTNNLRSGIWNYFYPDGKPLRKVKFNYSAYIVGEDFRILESYGPDGSAIIKDGTGNWSFTYDEYGYSRQIIVSGALSGGKKEGEWTCVFSNGEYFYKENFKNDRFKSGYFTNPDGSQKEVYTNEFLNKFLPPYKHEVTEKFLYKRGLTREHYPFFSFLPKDIPVPVTTAPDNTGNPLQTDSMESEKKVFLVVESPPEYVGGLGAMYKFIEKNLKRLRCGFSGSVFVGFVVDGDGNVTEAAIIKGIGADCDREALRVVNLMPKWKPGTQSGRPVRVKFVLPVRF